MGQSHQTVIGAVDYRYLASQSAALEVDSLAPSLTTCELGTFGALACSASTEPLSGSIDGRSAAQYLRCSIIRVEAEAARLKILGAGRFDPELLALLDAVYILRGLIYFDPEAKQLHVAPPELNPAPALLPGEETYKTWLRGTLIACLLAEGKEHGINNRRLLSHVAVASLAHRLAEVRQANAAGVRA